MKNEIEYIEDNFIEYKDLCLLVGITQKELDVLIERKLIPNASYTIETTNKISSPLGDEIVLIETRKYFPKNTEALIKKNSKLKTSAEFKEYIKDEFVTTFLNSKDKRYGYGNILDSGGNVIMEKLELAFEEEWQYYLQGVYGICTLKATGAEIAKKEIAVKKLIEFNNKHNQSKLSEDDREVLIGLNDQFNEVSNLFAPYQRQTSSRGKYLDKILKLNALEKLIKNYS